MNITVRPATKLPKIIIHRKVAAYCRVSTLQEIQHHSLEAQREYYEKRILGTSGWEFVGIYADEASGSNNQKQRMVLSLAYMAQQSHAYAGRDSFAFSPLAKIKVPLRPAAAGNARPRCI